jgi:hypothetical protein
MGKKISNIYFFEFFVLTIFNKDIDNKIHVIKIIVLILDLENNF